MENETGTGKNNLPTQQVSGEGLIYSDPYGFKTGQPIDLRPQIKAHVRAQLKALDPTAGGLGPAHYAMIPLAYDPQIVDATRKFTPWVEIIPRVANVGLTAVYNYISAKGAATTGGLDPTLVETDDTFVDASKAIKYLYAVGRVLGPAMAGMPAWGLEGFQSTGTGLAGSGFTPATAPNAMQLTVLTRTRALREMEENHIWNGNSSTNTTQFDGIITQMSSTNTVDKNTSALDWDDTETAMQYAFDASGRPSVAGCSSAVLTDLRKIMIDTFGFRPTDITGGKLQFGIPSQLVLDTMIGPIPVIPSQYISNVAASKAFYFLDMEHIQMRVLQDVTFERLAQTGDFQKFFLKIYETLLMKNTAFSSSITEIS